MAFIWLSTPELKNAEAPRAMVARMDPQYDSYKSAPMPATSPTLSPTLSAIVAGLRGSSSGMSCSTLPTMSAPTSAAFVYIPPPTLAKRAWVEAPMPKVSMVVVITTSFWEVSGLSMKAFRSNHQIEMSRRPRPTTVSPITAPERNASLRPEFNERLTALAVLAEA